MEDVQVSADAPISNGSNPGSCASTPEVRLWMDCDAGIDDAQGGSSPVQSLAQEGTEAPHALPHHNLHGYVDAFKCLDGGRLAAPGREGERAMREAFHLRGRARLIARFVLNVHRLAASIICLTWVE